MQMEPKTERTKSEPNVTLEPFSVLVGKWKTTGTHPLVPGKIFHGRVTFEWIEGGAFLVMHSVMDEPEIPSGVSIIGSDDNGPTFSMLYFDERGVSRRYETHMRENVWEWWRDDPEFSQRMTCTIATDGQSMSSRGELSKDAGVSWQGSHLSAGASRNLPPLRDHAASNEVMNRL
jgi:hypothetical protein